MADSELEPRIAVFLDYENLAIGARESLGTPFDFRPVAEALAERGRVIHRKAYADWSYFDSDRRMLTRHQVELIDIPQKMGASRKNAADIKMAIDAIELALERDYITTFVICTGDSDLSPLVQKLRELDREVIGVGVRGSTSKLLPPACDEFMFYDNLAESVAAPEEERVATSDAADTADVAPSDITIVTTTLTGLASSSTNVRSSALKRAVLRKDPTFSESELGFRSFGALLKSLEDEGLISLEGTGDPFVTWSGSSATEHVDDLLLKVLEEAKTIPLTGLKTALKKADPAFSEKRLGYRTFGAFVRAAETRNVIAITGKSDARMVKKAAKKRR